MNISKIDNAIRAVFAASLGIVALRSRNQPLRLVAALASAGLTMRAVMSGKDPRITVAREAQMDEALADTFPASDPPASHLPDVPPANAEAKWQAHRRATTDLAE